MDADYGAQTLELIQSVVADAQRAAIPGSVGRDLNRPNAVLTWASELPVARTSYASSPLAVAIDGPGLFVLRAAGELNYGRLGDFHIDEGGALVDAGGRTVMGYRADASGMPSGDLTALKIGAADRGAGRSENFSIDERGVLAAKSRMLDARTQRAVQTSRPLGRLALAAFPAPERLSAAGDTTLRATAAAGSPLIVAAGHKQMSLLRPHALEHGIDLQSDLARLWALRRRAECEAAVAGAQDRCARSALALVK